MKIILTFFAKNTVFFASKVNMRYMHDDVAKGFFFKSDNQTISQSLLDKGHIQ